MQRPLLGRLLSFSPGYSYELTWDQTRTARWIVRGKNRRAEQQTIFGIVCEIFLSLVFEIGARSSSAIIRGMSSAAPGRAILARTPPPPPPEPPTPPRRKPQIQLLRTNGPLAPPRRQLAAAFLLPPPSRRRGAAAATPPLGRRAAALVSGGGGAAKIALAPRQQRPPHVKYGGDAGFDRISLAAAAAQKPSSSRQ